MLEDPHERFLKKLSGWDPDRIGALLESGYGPDVILFCIPIYRMLTPCSYLFSTRKPACLFLKKLRGGIRTEMAPSSNSGTRNCVQFCYLQHGMCYLGIEMAPPEHQKNTPKTAERLS